MTNILTSSPSHSFLIFFLVASFSLALFPPWMITATLIMTIKTLAISSYQILFLFLILSSIKNTGIIEIDFCSGLRRRPGSSLSARAELDTSFTQTKRNKALWEAIAARMQHKGFTRTVDQCKSKWKNLVTRYKGSEAMELGDNRQFPFQEEMRSIFVGRMERSLLGFDDNKGKEKEKEKEEVEGEEGKCKKKKEKRRRKGGGEVAEVLRDFAKKQMEIEERWMEAVEAREAERRWEEEEWRRRMTALEEERAAMERRWREREEEWRAREEARAERRHAIITAILSKVVEDSSLQD